MRKKASKMTLQDRVTDSNKKIARCLPWRELKKKKKTLLRTVIVVSCRTRSNSDKIDRRHERAMIRICADKKIETKQIGAEEINTFVIGGIYN